MLSLDGDRHARHRAPFAPPFRPLAVRDRFARRGRARPTARSTSSRRPARRSCGARFAGPLAAAMVTRALGLARDEVAAVLAWYDAIVAAVTEITAGQPVAGLRARGVRGAARASDRGDPARADRGLAARRGRRRPGADRRPDRVQRRGAPVRRDRDDRGDDRQRGRSSCSSARRVGAPSAPTSSLVDAAIEESLRLEPAAAVVDRYATATWSSTARDRARRSRAALDRRRQPRPVGVRRPRRASTWTAPTPAGIWRSPTARTCAWASIWRASRPGPRCDRCCARLPALRLDPERPARIARAGVPQAARASRDLGEPRAR